jgi:fructose-1,6-bisphosphatase/inositol monophosphatase family enzyme
MQDFRKELIFATLVAKKAGAIMRQYFDGDQQVGIKEDGSPVTIADKMINTLVIEELKTAFPEDGLIGEEESTAEYGDGRKWFCDPIDGTKAFTWGTPTAMFSLALVIDGQPVMGVAYDPFLERLYTGIKGEGSFCNDKQLHVSKVPLTQGVVAVSSDALLISRGIQHIQKLDRQGVRLAAFSGAVCKSVLVS